MFSHLLNTNKHIVLVDSLGGAPFHVFDPIVFIADSGDHETNLETARRAIRTDATMHSEETTQETERTDGASGNLAG